MTDRWITRETEVKEAHFRNLLGMHLQICKGIGRRWVTPPYLYIDLHGGPGHLEYEGRRFDGSPLIAHDLLTKSGIPYEAMHFEVDAKVAARLAEALWVPTNLFDCLDSESAPIINEPFEQGLQRWLDGTNYRSTRYGLVYSDPINTPIPVDVFNAVTTKFPRVDLLAYVAANDQYKRPNGAGCGHGRKIAEDIAAVNKRVVLLRRPRTAHQWTFIVWSNWDDFPSWERRGFHRLDSVAGRLILDDLNLTRPELHRKYNTPLWEEGADAALPAAPAGR